MRERYYGAVTDSGYPSQYPHNPDIPYGAPTPGPAGAQVPEQWRSRFEFFSRYGHPASTPAAQAAFKQLSFGQRMRLGANGPAFFFGPIYFAIKGPWRKGLSLFGFSFVLAVVISVIEIALNFSFPSAAYGAAIGVLYSSTANWAYFLHVTRGSTSWNPFEGAPMFRGKR